MLKRYVKIELNTPRKGWKEYEYHSFNSVEARDTFLKNFKPDSYRIAAEPLAPRYAPTNAIHHNEK